MVIIVEIKCKDDTFSFIFVRKKMIQKLNKLKISGF